jgi:hypothetical protein
MDNFQLEESWGEILLFLGGLLTGVDKKVLCPLGVDLGEVSFKTLRVLIWAPAEVYDKAVRLFRNGVLGDGVGAHQAM